MQSDRLFGIVRILLDKEHVTAKYLAEHFEVSVRTIYRDIDLLSVSGVPVMMEKGRNGGISILPGYSLDKSLLTEKEREDILSSVLALSEISLDEDKSTMRKLTEIFGESDDSWLEVIFSDWGNSESEQNIYRDVKGAIRNRNVMSFSYASSIGEMTDRQVEPRKLVFRNQAWYLYGFCRLRNDFRYFKLRRIFDMKILKEKFVPKKCEEKNSDSVAIYDEDSFIVAKLLFEESEAYRVLDEFPGCATRENGKIVVETSFPNLYWATGVILSYGDRCEVLAPQELRDELKQSIKRMSRKYGGNV